VKAEPFGKDEATRQSQSQESFTEFTVEKCGKNHQIIEHD